MAAYLQDDLRHLGGFRLVYAMYPKIFLSAAMPCETYPDTSIIIANNGINITDKKVLFDRIWLCMFAYVE